MEGKLEWRKEACERRGEGGGGGVRKRKRGSKFRRCVCRETEIERKKERGSEEIAARRLEGSQHKAGL